MHAALGALSGAIAGGKEGAAAGATGAVIAETIADILAPNRPTLARMKEIEYTLGRQFTQEEFEHHWQNQTQAYFAQIDTHADIAKFAGVSAAFLARQDVGIAHAIGAQAIDHNFLHVIGLGVIAGSTAYSAYNVYSAYSEGGAEAAIKQLGIEVVTEFAGIATSAFVGKVVSKIGYKFGPKLYRTAQAAIDASLAEQPGLRLALGKLSDELVAGAEKVGASALGKAVKKADQLAKKATNKIANGITNHLNGLGEDLAAAHVPSSVATKIEGRAAQQAVADLRRAIVNREKLMTDIDCKKIGFIGTFQEFKGVKQSTGRIAVNTELEGGFGGATNVYEAQEKDISRSRKLVEEGVDSTKNGEQMIFSRFQDDSRVQLRTFGKSGHPKVDITDTVKNIQEKITFK